MCEPRHSFLDSTQIENVDFVCIIFAYFLSQSILLVAIDMDAIKLTFVPNGYLSMQF